MRTSLLLHKKCILSCAREIGTSLHLLGSVLWISLKRLSSWNIFSIPVEKAARVVELHFISLKITVQMWMNKFCKTVCMLTQCTGQCERMWSAVDNISMGMVSVRDWDWTECLGDIKPFWYSRNCVPAQWFQHTGMITLDSFIYRATEFHYPLSSQYLKTVRFLLVWT
jgi:hypothetical protein